MLQTENTSVSELMDNTQEITEHSLVEDVSHDERRKFPRRAARWSATITTKDKTVVQCRTRDVSEKGASIAIPYDFNMNAVVILEISVVYKEFRKKLRVLGQVKHSSVASDGYTIGVFIKDAADQTSKFLRAYSNKQI